MPKAPVDTRLSRKAYDKRLPQLREELVRLQVTLKDAPFRVLLILAGVEGAGRGEVINTLNGWLDPRGVETFAFNQPTDEERQRPLMWRYWRSLPAVGRIGVYAESWYTETLQAETNKRKVLAQLDHELERIRHFEKLLSDDDTLVIKVWLHLSKSAQRARLRALAQNSDTAWRVTPEHWKHHRLYVRLARLSENILRATHRPGAPWKTIEADDERKRNIAVGELLLSRFTEHARRVARQKPPRITAKATKSLRPVGLKRLKSLPLDHELSAADYEAKREKWLGKLNRVVRAAHEARRSVVFVFEGWDAAGKGGVIRRLTSAIDARDYRVIPVGKPTDEEKSHHYLWRFWRHIPPAGMVTIFDRSWYGRVLVERLEGFAHEREWRRAYDEICDFESQLAERGMIVIKFWLQISKDEQLRRFREREKTPYKRHKITEEDWRNRGKWSSYEVAVGDMLALTDHKAAPWHLIAANNKRFARLQVLKLACREIEKAMEA